MLKKIALLSGIIAAGVLSLGLEAKAVNLTGSNLVSVYSCERSGSDIRVKTSANASSYILTSSCRDAGHGLRNYTLTCTSATQYRVQWSDCSNSNPRPEDNQGPIVNVSASVVTNSVTDNRYSYQVTVNASDTSNIRGIKVTVREQGNSNVVQSWWVDGRNGQSSSETGFGSTSVNKTVTKTGLQTGKTYTVSAVAYDVRGNSTTATASNTLYVAGNTDNTDPRISAAVTYTVVSSADGTRKVVPTLSARATDTSKVTKVELFYSNGSNYRTIKSCTNNSTSASCTYTFTSPTSGSFYATAWDEAGNSVTSEVYSF